MPESLWTCKVKNFGPLIVSIDANGNNFFEKNKIEFNRKKNLELEKMYGQLHFIK